MKPSMVLNFMKIDLFYVKNDPDSGDYGDFNPRFASDFED